MDGAELFRVSVMELSFSCRRCDIFALLSITWRFDVFAIVQN